jgi:hypothetical protein
MWRANQVITTFASIHVAPAVVSNLLLKRNSQFGTKRSPVQIWAPRPPHPHFSPGFLRIDSESRTAGRIVEVAAATSCPFSSQKHLCRK